MTTETLICTEIQIDPTAPWRNTMRFTTCDGRFDVTAPYDPTIGIGQTVTITITATQEQTTNA